MKLSIKDIFSKRDKIVCFLWIWSYLLKTSLTENFIVYAVPVTQRTDVAQTCILRTITKYRYDQKQPSSGAL